tara:strand:+ start:2696 stop:2884 length:189 start_codon:yes stop_codon:yes gene_type:complete
MSKMLETNELMLAMERMLIDKLNASITGHGQMTTGNYAADFNAKIDGKEYTITIEQMEEDDE